MTTVELTAPAGLALPEGRKGPVTARRQRMTWATYGAVVAVGVLLWLFAPSPAWQAFGLGLWAPGAGFLATGGWAALLIIPTLILFALAVFAWFGAGAIVFPILVWLGAAAAAGALTGGQAWSPAPAVAAALILAFVAWQAHRLRRADAALAETRRQRLSALPAAMAAVEARAAPIPEAHDRELTPEMLAGVNYLLERALQPVGEFNGFDQIDIFQTASVRYQINFIGYALSLLQTHYLPSFRGYLARGQRQLIEKYLLRRVWSYWIYESIWGHLNVTNWDPCGRDNIMLTGYFGAQVNLYMIATGDRRYEEPGSLTFRLNGRTAYPHDAHSINRSLIGNFEASPYCLYPCEPNWIYPACNFRGMLSLASYDTLFGTRQVKGLERRYWRQLDEEFSDASGSIIGLRSSLTGMPFPFPGSDLVYSPLANVLEPDRGRRMWTTARMGLERALIERDGVPVLALPEGGIDFGNYRRGARTLMSATILQIAREFGDEEIAIAACNSLDAVGGRVLDNGVLRFLDGSNVANINAVQGIFARRDDIRRTHVEGPPASSRTGPQLDEVPFPDVLVAAAHSDGEDLSLVLRAPAGGAHKLAFAKLRPGARYGVAGRPDLGFIADDGGRATITIEIGARTPLRIVPDTPS